MPHLGEPPPKGHLRQPQTGGGRGQGDGGGVGGGWGWGLSKQLTGLRLGEGNANLALLTAQWFAINRAHHGYKGAKSKSTPGQPLTELLVGVFCAEALEEFHQLIIRVARERHQR